MSYSVNEAAKLVGKNPRKIKLDIRQGKLEASRLGDKPNSAYRIEYKDLRKTYSTSFEPQPSGDGAQMSGPQGDAGPDVTGGLPQPAVPEDRSVLGGQQGEDEILEDEPDILRAALAREVRNNRIIQKQLTDAVKRIERLLSGQVARGNTSMPPLTLEPHMRPSGPPHHSIPETKDTDASMTPGTNSEVSENVTSAAETASGNMSAELAPVSNTTTNTPEVDHVPVLSSVLAEDPKPKPKAEAEAENTAEKHKKQHKKSPITEMSSVSHDDEEVPEDDDDEIPVNELIKNYQARLDASLDMIRNLRAD